MAKLQSPLVASKGPRPSGDAQRMFAVICPPLARASFMRNDSPSVRTTTLWCCSRSSRLTTVVCSGKKWPQSSKGQSDAMPSARFSQAGATRRTNSCAPVASIGGKPISSIRMRSLLRICSMTRPTELSASPR
jgi:hypothetical protein